MPDLINPKSYDFHYKVKRDCLFSVGEGEKNDKENGFLYITFYSN